MRILIQLRTELQRSKDASVNKSKLYQERDSLNDKKMTRHEWERQHQDLSKQMDEQDKIIDQVHYSLEDLISVYDGELLEELNDLYLPQSDQAKVSRFLPGVNNATL